MNDIRALDRRHLWHPYTQAQTAPEPLEILSGRGATLYGADGKEYLDLVSSWWVNLHGHAHPAIVRAISEQAARLEQVIFADFTHAPAVELAARLVEKFGRLPGDKLSRVFYSDDGSTAVEVALKASLQYWRNVEGAATRRTRIVAFEGAYHGDTFGAMAAGARSGFFDAFGPKLFDVEFLPFPATFDGDAEVEQKERAALDALERLIARRGAELAAAIVEPLVQGASGMRFCRPRFLSAFAERLTASGALLICDEVMTGFGRTGTLFASEQAALSPDFMTLSKGLTGGYLPLSVTACKESIYQAFLGPSFSRALAHGHSFTANPLGCAAALGSLALFESERSLERVAKIERLHRERMARLAKLPRVTSPRVLGAIASFDVKTEGPGYDAAVGRALKERFYSRGLLIRPMGSNVYLLPPYCITDEELHRAYDALEEAMVEPCAS